MIFRRPPALANWLLDRLGCTRQNAALAGDLLEEFRNGRPAAWYWRQSLGVIARGIAHNGIVLRPYLLALGAAYAAQLAVALTLWSRRSPPPVHATGWMKVGVWALAQLTYAGCTGLVNRVVAGVSVPDLKRMYCAVESGPPQSTILGLAAYQSFSLGLANYCLCALIFPRFSLAGLAAAEMAWLVLWIFTPALALPSASPTAAEPVPEEQPWLGIPESEPILPVVLLQVALSSGRTVILELQSLAQSVFAAADPELIAAVFARRRSLELLRRAVWLGGCRTRSFIRGSAESFTLAELAALIDEAARVTSAGACPQANRRESLLQRLRLGFRGDAI